MSVSTSLKKSPISLTAICLALFMFMATGTAFAQNNQNGEGGFVDTFNQPGGFKGPGPTIATVEQAKQLQDDSKTAVQGNIIQHLGGRDYLFKDATGSVVIKISRKDWAGQTITPQDTVVIYAEVDRDATSFKLKADQIIKQ